MIERDTRENGMVRGEAAEVRPADQPHAPGTEHILPAKHGHLNQGTGPGTRSRVVGRLPSQCAPPLLVSSAEMLGDVKA